MASKYTLCVSTQSITFGVPVLDHITGEPLEPIVYEHITVRPDAAAWIPDRLVRSLMSKRRVVAYDQITHSYLPIPAEPVDAS